MLVNEVSEAFALARAISSQESTCQQPRFWVQAALPQKSEIELGHGQYHLR